MRVVHTNDEVRDQVARWRAGGGRIALVPTMGNLHAGHMRLVEHAMARAEHVVVSLFVNPTQFAPGEDFESYPRTFEADAGRLREAGVDLLYAPQAAELYPYGTERALRVEVPALADMLCGEHRPGHFTGVATVVAKLFSLITPDLAVFGEKDYQQLLLARRLAEELLMPVTVEGVPTVREPDGLAMSSRNRYLDADERARAPELYRTLQAVAQRARAAGADSPACLEREALERLRAHGFRPEYVSIRRAEDLGEPRPRDRAWVVLVAARLGRARLIDNLTFRLD